MNRKPESGIIEKIKNEAYYSIHLKLYILKPVQIVKENNLFRI